MLLFTWRHRPVAHLWIREHKHTKHAKGVQLMLLKANIGSQINLAAIRGWSWLQTFQKSVRCVRTPLVK